MNKLLYDLQEADNLIAKLARDRQKLDDGSSLAAQRDELQRAVSTQEAKLKELNSARTDRELELKTTEEKIARQQKRLMNANNAHEVTALERDIVGLGHARGDHEEAILLLMDEIDAAAARLSELREALGQKTVQTSEAQRNFAAETARLEHETLEAKSHRAAIAAGLDPVSLQKYTTVASQRHGVALGHNEKGTCSACGMALTPFALRQAQDEEWPTCDGCGRLLFIV